MNHILVLSGRYFHDFTDFALISKWSQCGKMQPQRRRHNGCTWPPSFLQLLFWVTIPIIASSTAFLLIPLHVLYAPIAVFTATIWLILQIIILTCIDPAVNNLQKNQVPAYFDASKHEHVIENLFCNICLINVLLSSCYDKVKSNKNIRSGLSQPVSLTTLSQSPMQFYNEKKKP
ncbi:unnamed protein product [Wuchereria bancrofti]|uniref:Palmitoyltransferase n=1 Tax=Wuchereria bancrofti TaxID=6293 RepID=A0A3P7GL89_WUCBA|nr:unnamed protein product [Wuchereria bancrofti]